MSRRFLLNSRRADRSGQLRLPAVTSFRCARPNASSGFSRARSWASGQRTSKQYIGQASIPKGSTSSRSCGSIVARKSAQASRPAFPLATDPVSARLPFRLVLRHALGDRSQVQHGTAADVRPARAIGRAHPGLRRIGAEDVQALGLEDGQRVAGGIVAQAPATWRAEVRRNGLEDVRRMRQMVSRSISTLAKAGCVPGRSTSARTRRSAGRRASASRLPGGATPRTTPRRSPSATRRWRTCCTRTRRCRW
jgi:hypothetical protein